MSILSLMYNHAASEINPLRYWDTRKGLFLPSQTVRREPSALLLFCLGVRENRGISLTPDP